MTNAAPTRARYRRILRFAARHLATMWWFEVLLPRLGLAGLAARGRAARLTRLARRFHGLAVELGGLMIKVGQFLSSRLDVLPPEITRELEGLQDEAPPVPFAPLRAAIERDLGMPLERAYAAIDPGPLAAASLGQAHRATLTDVDAAMVGGADAVVKVQRPGIRAIVDTDLEALRVVARWLSRVRIVARRVDTQALVEEFAQTSLEEVDYLHEAASAERFAAAFEDDPRVAVPHVVWERTTRQVLTLADVTAIKLTDVDALRAAGIDPSEVAQAFASVMFDQLFVHGFFHADPHPGNLFVTPTPDAAPGEPRWRLTFIDFGMMGEIPASTRSGLRSLLIAAAARDGRGLVAAIQEVGALLPSADTAELERAMTKAFARFGGMGFAELREVDPREFRDFALEFQELMRSLPFQLPEHFLLVIRAMSLTSGVCSSLDPRFNLWDAVEPYAAGLVRDGRGNLARAAVDEALALARLVVGLPRRLDRLATRAEEGRLAVESPRLERRVARLERATGRVVSALLFTGLLVAGAIVRSTDAVLGTVLMVASVVPLAHAVLAGVIGRSRSREP
ncbi:ABC1 kinase family protein [Agrococcus carbonis]|uniref:Predicted unusual protein kinase regulating ubiquinone biosynthesis, AarF/ABC1/UbiB family n=1 Tax=Agrococcus carbonis TaxID=684552 RepID=A0A1H1KU18_9MICO|nr:AarF/UbiB family protein [Agrococcus carbonis]SDR65275.1 Predicted unusual protein kinase regulating ubiquinone biosynthesis, AarF/ABC1/UbiB family [Agrococcus carbonis]